MAKHQLSFDHSPMECARQMAHRHSDIGFIRSYVLAQFGTAPSREQITKLREEALRAIEWQAAKHDRAYERIVRVRDTHKRERRA